MDKRALQQKQEAVAALRRRHRIHISPGTPDLVESFDDMASRSPENSRGGSIGLSTVVSSVADWDCLNCLV